MNILSVALATAMLLFPVKDVMEQPVRMLTVEEAQTMTQSEEVFGPMSWTTRPLTTGSTRYGYMYMEYDISRADYTEDSALYLAHVKISFVPGYAAYQNDFEYQEGIPFEENAYLKSGYVQIELVNAGSPGNAKSTPKAMWPNSNDFQTTFSSSYGGSLSISNTLEAGIELGNGGTLKADFGGSTTTGMSFSFAKQMSTLTEDPFVSAQFENSNPNCAAWNFEIVNPDVAGKVTYAIDVYLLVEAASNGGSDEYVEFRVHHRMRLQREVRGNYEEIDLKIPASDRYFLESSPLIEACFYNF